MNNKVNVKIEKDGSYIHKSEGGKGHIKLYEKRVMFKNGRAITKEVRTILKGDLGTLESIKLNKDNTLNGKIVIEESLVPFRDATKDIKVAGLTKTPCKLKGKIIYRKTYYTNDINTEDILISHDNHEELSNSFKKLNLKADLS